MRKHSHSLGCVLTGAFSSAAPLPHSVASTLGADLAHILGGFFRDYSAAYGAGRVGELELGGLGLCGLVRAFADGGLLAPDPCLKLSQVLMEVNKLV